MPLTPTIANQRFYEHLWPHRGAVLRMARILTGNDADAEDSAQETLLKALAAIESFKTGTNPRAWLIRILRNARIDRIRSAAREGGAVSIEAAEIDVADPRPAEATTEWEQPAELLNAFSDAQIIDALQQLPEEIRLTLLLVEVEGITQQEAAEILEVPLGTIKSRGHRGRAMLREALLPMAKELRLVK
jgi:RNA polymerase sigma-70 factor (ECF subfamily)